MLRHITVDGWPENGKGMVKVDDMMCSSFKVKGVHTTFNEVRFSAVAFTWIDALRFIGFLCFVLFLPDLHIASTCGYIKSLRY